MSNPDGAHLAFPFRVGPDGRSAQVASKERHVADEIIQLLLTNPGERPFLPEFGGGARRLMFEGASEATKAMTKALISQSLQRWLAHRVSVEDLKVELEDTRITVDLQYRIAGQEDSRRLRFERSA